MSKITETNLFCSEMLLESNVHQAFDPSAVFIGLEAAQGRREFMNDLELGRAQGFIAAWQQIR